MMNGLTHVLTYHGGVQTAEISARKDISTFLNPLRHFNGDDRWGLGLAPLPPDKSYSDMLRAGELSAEYIQAGGLPDALTVEIRKPGGEQWGAKWVRYTIGHPHSGTEPLDVPIRVAGGVKMISRSQVFDADEAAELFFAYYKTGDIPPGYVLQPIEGYRADGSVADVHSAK
ncbi:Uncharacterised protein [Mycobacteroides abscessus]|nr:Uncharacterised protein [Mycobacteroides abscessus]CPU70521.1 Uncharacterised protein [Mycobacteroides abscessus]